MSSSSADLRFVVPPLPPHHIPRPRLLKVLDEADSAALTLVSAGAGAGKTVLLSDWAGYRRGPLVWLALTAEDNDPRRFWRLFLEGGQASGQTYPPLAWASGRTAELLDSVLGRGVVPQPRLTVVLDDAHVLTDPQILDGLDRLVGRWSDRVRLLMTARSDPLVPLHRYRLAGQVCEIRAADLAMTEAETADLLTAHGVALAAADLRLLTARTEGWAAGLRLAALRMQGSARPADFVAVLAMDQGSIGEYLTAEVLALQSDAVSRLLVETSFLDEVTGPLADAVTGSADSGPVLAGLARQNSFIIPLDPAQTTFRYHPLFREVLRHLAGRQPAPLVRARYARAAAWYRQQGDLVSALRWTVRAEDAAATRALLVHGGLVEAFVHREHLENIRPPAFDDGPAPADATGAERLEFEVGRWAIAAAATGPDTARAALDGLPPIGPELAAAQPEVHVAAAVAQLVLAQKAGDRPAVDRAAEHLLVDPDLAGSVAAVPGLGASVRLIQAQSQFAAGRLADVQALLQRALAEAERDRMPGVLLDVLSMLAFVTTSAGRLRSADDLLRRATEVAAAHPRLTRRVVLDLALARRAELAADWVAMDAAVDRVLAAGPVYPDNGIAATVAIVQAVRLVARGEFATAQALLRHDRAINSTAVGTLAVLRDVALAEIDIRLGRPHAALRLLHPHQRPPYAVAVGVTAARAHLALGQLQDGAACVRAVLTTPSPFVTRRLAVEATLCEAEIADRTGDEGAATGLLDRALQLAEGLRVPFVETTRTFAGLLARHPALAARWPDAVSAPPEPVAGAGIAGGELADPLTPREQAVLRLMASSLSTAEIAGELHLSVNTVKSHLAAIYRKLAVGRRREAVRRARELELL